MRGDRPGPEPDRPARPRGVQGRRGAGHPGRVARGFGRRLAGLGRHLPRHQADPGRRRPPRPTPSGASAGADSCPTISLLNQPEASRAGRTAGREPRHASTRRWPRAWSSSTAGWPRTSARSSTWSPRSTCSAASAEWEARQEALEIFDDIVDCVGAVGRPRARPATTRNWDGPLKRIIPWVTNDFTETIIREAQQALGDDFWGFLMLGGMAGGGMAFFVAPHRHDAFQDEIAAIMRRVKASSTTPCRSPWSRSSTTSGSTRAGTFAALDSGAEAMMPPRYYALQVPRMIADGTPALDPAPARADVDHFANHCRRHRPTCSRVFRTMVNHLFPVTRSAADTTRPPTGTRRPSGSAARTASTPSSTSSSARTSSAGGSAWRGTACRSTSTSATSTTPT